MATPYEAGPVYVPFPTGSGKTVGAVWGITKAVEQYPDKRICFLTPYRSYQTSCTAPSARHLAYLVPC